MAYLADLWKLDEHGDLWITKIDAYLWETPSDDDVYRDRWI